ncbi:MAG: hypothetical protein ACRD0R_00300 [Acidimicrobiales bacterium]
MRINFIGLPVAFEMFIEALEEEGIEVEYERPKVRATGAALLWETVVWLVDNAASAAVGVAVGAGYERARAKVQARFQKAWIEKAEDDSASE